jgi:hypothetical protein
MAMIKLRGSARLPLAAMPLLPALLGAGPAAPSGGEAALRRDAAGGRGEQYVVLRFAAAAGRRLAAERWRAVADGLSAGADAAGVIICRGGVASTLDPAFDRLCAEAEAAATPLWWDASLALKPGNPTTAALSLQLDLGERPPARAPALIAFAPVVVPASGDASAAERTALHALAGAVAANPEVHAWFRVLRHRPGVARFAVRDSPRPADQGGPPDAADPRVSSPAEDEPDARLPRAAHPAGEPDAPQLRAAQPAGEPDAAAPRAAPVELWSGSPGDAAGEVTFAVRQAVVGKGFGVGPEGRLSISPQGMKFTPLRSGRPGWSLAWRELASAARDQGIWEVPFVVVLRTKDGSRRHIAQLDANGRCVSGRPILEAIAARARGSRQSAEAAASGEREPRR